MKVAEMTPCDACKHASVCMFLKDYKKIKNEIESISSDIDTQFLRPIDPACKYFERISNSIR